MEKIKVVILAPVYNDWQSFALLQERLLKVSRSSNIEIAKVIAVNDCSSLPYEEDQFISNLSVKVINLNINLGHQRAIAVGLAYVNKEIHDVDGVVVMDSDGEDDPVYLPEMCALMKEHNAQKIVFAQRKKRQEGFLFQMFYLLYKFVFKILTNKSISFGNYSCIPRKMLDRVVSIPELWNHFSGAIIKSKIPYAMVPTNRAKRYFGKSKMNFQNLVLHGLSSVAIYLDIVVVKLLTYSIGGGMIVFFSIMVIIYIRLFTDKAIPGWASNIVLALVNLAGSIFIITLLLLLSQLNQRSNPPLMVKNFFKDFVNRVDEF